MDLIQLYSFLLYMTVINIVIYLILSVLYIYFRNTFIKLHLRILKFGDKHKGEFESLLLSWLSKYKLLIFMFNIVPLISVYLMTS